MVIGQTTLPESESIGACASGRRRYIALYYAIACGISWTIWTPAVVGQQGLKLLRIAPSGPVIISLGTLGPFVAAFVTHRLESGNWRPVRLFPVNKLRLLWFVLGPALVVFCMFVVFPALISKGSPERWNWHPGVLAGIFVPMFNYNLLGGPLFEEFGWRGFLQTRLQDAVPSWIAAISVGAMWAAWHWPLFLVHGFTSVSPAVFFVILIGLSMVMAFGFNASGKVVIAAILMHSAFNSSPRFLNAYLGSVSTRVYPSAGLLIAISFLSVGTLLTILTRGRLAAKRAWKIGDGRDVS